MPDNSDAIDHDASHPDHLRMRMSARHGTLLAQISALPALKGAAMSNKPATRNPLRSVFFIVVALLVIFYGGYLFGQWLRA